MEGLSHRFGNHDALDDTAPKAHSTVVLGLSKVSILQGYSGYDGFFTLPPGAVFHGFSRRQAMAWASTAMARERRKASAMGRAVSVRFRAMQKAAKE